MLIFGTVMTCDSSATTASAQPTDADAVRTGSSTHVSEPKASSSTSAAATSPIPALPRSGAAAVIEAS